MTVKKKRQQLVVVPPELTRQFGLERLVDLALIVPLQLFDGLEHVRSRDCFLTFVCGNIMRTDIAKRVPLSFSSVVPARDQSATYSIVM